MTVRFTANGLVRRVDKRTKSAGFEPSILGAAHESVRRVAGDDSQPGPRKLVHAELPARPPSG
jgi:hypothetical protein